VFFFSQEVAIYRNPNVSIVGVKYVSKTPNLNVEAYVVKSPRPWGIITNSFYHGAQAVVLHTPFPLCSLRVRYWYIHTTRAYDMHKYVSSVYYIYIRVVSTRVY
jgi:hypothetical protein